MNTIEIWAPKWSTQEVLIAKKKVSELNDIIFTKAKSLGGKRFRLTREQIISNPTGTNGKIEVYKVPLKLVEENELTEKKYR